MARSARLRVINGPHLVALVRARFERGRLGGLLERLATPAAPAAA